MEFFDIKYSLFLNNHSFEYEIFKPIAKIIHDPVRNKERNL